MSAVSARRSAFPAAGQGTGGPAPPPSGSGGSAPPPQSYFTDVKRSEVTELQSLLRSLPHSASEKRRDAIKKVIAYMTLGIDVSALFSDIVVCVETRDLTVKKMVYLFLTTYANQNENLMLMCINTLHKDCYNTSPIIRGLAIRALCSLRVANVVEYVLEPVSKGLDDGNGYVRKTCVFAVIKTWTLPGLTEDQKASIQPLIDKVFGMMDDVDSNVVCNVIRAVKEIKAEVSFNQMCRICQRMGDFDENAKYAAMDLLYRCVLRRFVCAFASVFVFS